ncbi:jg27026 [Pararge aegeria aegeria]|uniref:Jg27026 protein n=1 Tax=Pararge aegeria aegeria TaxID=348720 RepID=A0A8S4SIZ5_9NEOP|nr:jg27026 [Pararge aegeria aegeria]
MYTLKGIFPEPKKEQKKNFIRENMKQLKLIQGKSPKESKFALKSVNPPRLVTPNAVANNLGQVKSSPSNKSAKATLVIGKNNMANTRKKHTDIRIKKGDMAEFLKRKETRTKQEDVIYDDTESSHSSGRLRDIACQTMESNLTQKLADSTKLTMLYPTREDDQEAKMKASGDNVVHRSPPLSGQHSQRIGDDLMDERNRSRLNAILERKDKDPYLPSGYQRGVVPKYLRERKETAKEVEEAKASEDNSPCPPGHVALPNVERKETLRMLRNSKCS